MSLNAEHVEEILTARKNWSGARCKMRNGHFKKLFLGVYLKTHFVYS